MRTISLLGLLACTPPAPERSRPVDFIVGLLPAGTTTAIVQTIDDSASASPEALRQYLHSTAAIESRESLADGFAVMLDHDVHIVRERHNRWYWCHATVTNDAMRDRVIAVCRSYRLPALH